MQTQEIRSPVSERARQENQSLAADIEWLETEYTPIKEAWIAAENRRRRIYDALRQNGMIALFE